MAVKKMGYLIVGVGIFGILFSFGIDIFGFGKPGIQAAQLLGIQLGVFLGAIGLGLIYNKTHQSEKIGFGRTVRDIYEWLLNLPTIIWIVIGFLIAYVFLFIFPVLLNPDHRFQYLYRYLPDKFPIGLDLNTIVEAIKVWMASDQSPYLNNADIFYPPLHHILLAPLLLLSYPQNYYFIVTVILISTFLFSFLIPILINDRGNFSIPAFFFITVLFSYGFQFELERGQFNVITFTLCIFSIYLFYFHRSFRFLAYLLFSFSIHLRIYPAIFIVMFIDNWASWKQNLKRLFVIGILNIAFLFVLGLSVLIEFFQALSGKLGTAWTWIGNHSITSFVYNLTTSGLGLFDQDALNWLQAHSAFISMALLIYFMICFVALILKDYRKKSRGLNPDLLLVCTLGGMMIPSVSHDYKLALLAGPMAIALSNRNIASDNWRKLFSAFLITLMSLSFSITLFPFKYRPIYLENSFPLLFIILTAMTLLSFISAPKYLGVGIEES